MKNVLKYLKVVTSIWMLLFAAYIVAVGNIDNRFRWIMIILMLLFIYCRVSLVNSYLRGVSYLRKSKQIPITYVNSIIRVEAVMPFIDVFLATCVLVNVLVPYLEALG